MFYFRLAALFGKPVRQVLAELDSVELAEWRAFDRLSPIDHARRGEVSAGILAATLAAPHCSDTPKASDYMRNYEADWLEDQQENEPSQDVIADKLDAMFGAYKK